MRDTTQQLRKELQAAGASKAELEELVPIASRLSVLKDESDAHAKTKTGIRWQKLLRPALIGVSSFAVGMLLVVVSQAASPTSLLYPVQKFSDSVAVDLHPQYRATVMMKRAQQVNQLVVDHAGSNKVLATLADYTKQASAYKSTPHANYAAFEYCKTNLQQAASAASPAVREAISNSLQSLQSV